MDGIAIRDYRKTDFPQVKLLWSETGLGKGEQPDDIRTIESCLSKGGKFLVMEDTGKMLIIGTSWKTTDGRSMLLHHFGIKPEYQLRGLGTRLAKTSLDYVHSAGYQVKLEVHRNNLIARHIYLKLGFCVCTDYDIFMIRDVKDIPPGNRESLQPGPASGIQ